MCIEFQLWYIQCTHNVDSIICIHVDLISNLVLPLVCSLHSNSNIYLGAPEICEVNNLYRTEDDVSLHLYMGIPINTRLDNRPNRPIQ